MSDTYEYDIAQAWLDKCKAEEEHDSDWEYDEMKDKELL